MTSAELNIALPAIEAINIMRLEEAIAYAQRVTSFDFYADRSGTFVKVFEETTIGRSRIVVFRAMVTTKLKIIIKDALAAPT